MIKPQKFYECLIKNEIDFFTGVPDSLLKNICAYISDHSTKNHIIAANEGNAIAIAMGYHMASEKIPMVYMQNSGLGNTINPLLSLADEAVYSIPMILMIGWRGKPGISDEPQHIKQGRIHNSLIDALEIPHFHLTSESNFEEVINKAKSAAEKKSAPSVISVAKNTFEKYTLKSVEKFNFEMSREEAIEQIAEMVDHKDVIISTTGKASRELFEFRNKKNDTHERDFLTVGGMGHASQIALGIALTKESRTIYCIDGDGSFLMHSGSMGIIGSTRLKNFKHIIINNGSHDSVGGQPTVALKIDLEKISNGFNYTKTFKVTKKEDLNKKFTDFKNCEGPCLLEIYVNKGSRKNLGRPTISPKNNKKDFISFLKDS